MFDRAKAFRAVALLALAACSDDPPAGPASAVPPVGTYEYVASLPASSAFPGARTYTGTMHVSASSRDEVYVIWNVPEFKLSQERGTWNGNAYEVSASLDAALSIVHQILHSGEGLSCTGELDWSRFDGGAREPVTCSLVVPRNPGR
jgi:hypothetical protein